MANIVCANYITMSRTNQYPVRTTTKAISMAPSGTLYISDPNYTDATALKNSLSGQYLYYELAEPVETPIASASLVSQNQEIPMTAEDDKLVAYSTAEVTEQSGFHDTKIKLSNDGVAYSAKFTMHIERKP